MIAVVDNPEMMTLSPSFKDGAVEINAETILPFVQVKMVSSNVSIVVSIDVRKVGSNYMFYDSKNDLILEKDLFICLKY